jgi:hypothetical protein
MTRRKGLVTNLGLAAASLCLGLLGAELGVRAFYPQDLGVWYEMRDGMVVHPANRAVYLAGFDQEIRFNSWGMRDREHREEKEEGTLRILLLGDSFMEALQVGFEESFPRHLEGRLHEALGRPVEVINCAVSGWSADAQFAYLTRYGLGLKPDLVLVAMTIHNDVSDNLEERFHTLVDGKLTRKVTRETPWLQYRILNIKMFLGSHSQLFQLVRRAKLFKEMEGVRQALDHHVLELIRPRDSAQLMRGWDLTRQLLKGIRDTARQIGAETAIVLIPLEIQVDGRARSRFLARHGVSEDEIVLTRPQAIMKEFGKTVGIDVIDLLPGFQAWMQQDRREAHIHGHWNGEAHRLAAGIVAAQMAERGLVRTPATASARPRASGP